MPDPALLGVPCSSSCTYGVEKPNLDWAKVFPSQDSVVHAELVREANNVSVLPTTGFVAEIGDDGSAWVGNPVWVLEDGSPVADGMTVYTEETMRPGRQAAPYMLVDSRRLIRASHIWSGL